MIKVLGENYYIDLDKVEEYLDMSDELTEGENSGNTETRINIIKFEMVKMLMDTVLTENEDIDEQLMDWTVQNKLSPDAMVAIVLARLTLVAKTLHMESLLISLMEQSKEKLLDVDDEKTMVH